MFEPRSNSITRPQEVFPIPVSSSPSKLTPVFLRLRSCFSLANILRGIWPAPNSESPWGLANSYWTAVSESVCKHCWSLRHGAPFPCYFLWNLWNQWHQVQPVHQSPSWRESHDTIVLSCSTSLHLPKDEIFSHPLSIRPPTTVPQKSNLHPPTQALGLLYSGERIKVLRFILFQSLVGDLKQVRSLLINVP